MADKAENTTCKLCDLIGLKKFNKTNVLNYYIPLHGVVSYAALGVNVMNPLLVAKLAPKRDMSNVLLLSTICGTACYLYGRTHLQHVPSIRRSVYAILGSSLFSLGSVLLWAVVKSSLPKDSALLSSVVGIASGACIVKISTDYFNDCDALVKK